MSRENLFLQYGEGDVTQSHHTALIAESQTVKDLYRILYPSHYRKIDWCQ